MCGQDPLLWHIGLFPIPWGTKEYDYAGALRGEPVKVAKGGVTQLPTPATAEIVLEGELASAPALLMPPGNRKFKRVTPWIG